VREPVQVAVHQRPYVEAETPIGAVSVLPGGVGAERGVEGVVREGR
jgi:hypothetical protein